jgi:hypothetical protein
MLGDKWIPNASIPELRNLAVVTPVPHLTSTTRLFPPIETSPAKGLTIARATGLSSR